jgi:hypothetical protein
VRAKLSRNFGVKFYDEGRRLWLDTYPTADGAARAYDVEAWHAGRPRTKLNFPEIEIRVAVEFLVLEGIWIEEMTNKKRPTIRVAHGDSDEAAMARFA